jgi:papain fold toxin 1 (glutamine deamidase) of polymorphic toxin system
VIERRGDDPLETMDDWVPLINQHYHLGVEFQFNCSSGIRGFADTVQGRPPHLAEGDFNRGVVWDDGSKQWVEGATPGDYDHSFQWMGVDGPYRQHTWTHPQHDRMDEIDQSLGQFTRDAYDSVGQDLVGRPPGTVAAVCVRWRSGGGHWFAAVVGKDGRIIHVDVQPRPPKIAPWPPLYPTELTRLEHIIREPGGDWEGAPPWEPNSTWDSHPPVGPPTEEGR